MKKTAEEIIRQDKYKKLANLVLICEAMDEYAAQFQTEDKEVEDDTDKFLKECSVERDKFVNAITGRGYDVSLRVVAEDILVMYDQLRERVLQSRPSIPDPLEFTEEDRRELYILRELRENPNRYFTQEEFDRLKVLAKKAWYAPDFDYKTPSIPDIQSWIPITDPPKENGEYILYRPESDSQSFAYYWQNENINGIKGWEIKGIPVNIEEYTHYCKPLSSPMV